MGFIMIEFKCVSCANRQTKECGNERCLRCIIDKHPDPNCLGVIECSHSKRNELADCRRYKFREWDA